jgi:hypothetical protein
MKSGSDKKSGEFRRAFNGMSKLTNLRIHRPIKSERCFAHLAVIGDCPAVVTCALYAQWLALIPHMMPRKNHRRAVKAAK